MKNKIFLSAIMLPFLNSDLQLRDLAEVRLQTPVNVASEIYKKTLVEDCSALKRAVESLKKTGKALTSEELQEFRTLPLKLTMQPDYHVEVRISSQKTGRFFPEEIYSLKWNEQNVESLIQDKNSLTQYFLEKSSVKKNGPILQAEDSGLRLIFKFRDNLCDFIDGKISLFVKTDVSVDFVENSKPYDFFNKIDKFFERLRYETQSEKVKAVDLAYSLTEAFDQYPEYFNTSQSSMTYFLSLFTTDRLNDSLLKNFKLAELFLFKDFSLQLKGPDFEDLKFLIETEKWELFAEKATADEFKFKLQQIEYELKTISLQMHSFESSQRTMTLNRIKTILLKSKLKTKLIELQKKYNEKSY